MPYRNVGTDVAFREPEWLHDLFTASITGAVAAQGDDLESLDWIIHAEDGEMYVRGTPTADCKRPVAVCRQWAERLGLREQHYDPDEDISTWYLYAQPWIIEVVASTR